ncbi:SusD family protein [Parapedobacter composti]|uniref:SusD family protein n=2 Tax=Parapedobacter composti TaxID=623281 RepID=A0A1I1HSE5_9SPHI|nr:SusD family protein [Parapedobacter composti]
MTVLIISCLGLLQSCEKWFDVTASDQIHAEHQFASADGFHDALMGIYIGMGGAELYAQDMTYNLVDLLSQQYGGLQNLARYFNIQQFNYEHVRSQTQIQNVWNTAYQMIANVNNALYHLEQADFPWNPVDKNLVKGELLGLRVFLHFDLLRLFGRSGLMHRPELADHPAIPYVTSFKNDIIPQRGYAETLQLMLQDLDGAIELLKDDPIYPNPERPEGYYNEVNRDGFYNDRTLRLNYFAVKSLKARVLSWDGRISSAAAIAEEVITSSPAMLLRSTTDVTVNQTMTEEHLFALYIDRFADIVNPYLSASNAADYNTLKIPNALAESVYETAVPGIGAVDVRYNTLLQSQALGMVPVKLMQANGHVDNNLMPLIKLPEMYYIAAEYYASSDLPKAIGLLNEVRASRRITTLLPNDLSRQAFDEELLKEYRKEYVSEGQLFFYYKRLGLTHIPNYSSEIIADDNIYMLPYPANEIEFGNRIQ